MRNQLRERHGLCSVHAKLDVARSIRLFRSERSVISLCMIEQLTLIRALVV